MSGFEFQANVAWRERIKKLLLMDRKPTTPIIKQHQRFSLDIADDLHTILEVKRIPKPGNMDDKSEKQQFVHVAPDETVYAQAQASGAEWPNDVSDDSFEAIEKMCDKTASDPNSTLFHYMSSDAKQEIVAAVKQRQVAPPPEPDAEDVALQRLLNQLASEKEQKLLEDESTLKSVGDVTQLEDIEAPSRLWDTSVAGETSPVKLVGLLRPSTILEECSDESGTSSLLSTSYQSATQLQRSEVTTSSSKQCNESDISTSCYETANNTEKTSTTAASNCYAPFDIQLMNSNDKNLGDYVDDDLIDLYDTFSEQQPSVHLTLREQTTDSSESDKVETHSDEQLIVISDDDDEDENTERGCKLIDKTIKSEANFSHLLTAEPLANDSKSLEFQSTESDEGKSKAQGMPSGESLSLAFTEDDEENKENATNISADGSMHFNDTIEEVDYLMRKGLEYLGVGLEGSKDAGLKTATKPTTSAQKQNTFKKTLAAASPHKTMPVSKLANRFALNIKPIRRMEMTFKKPTGTAGRTPLSHLHKEQHDKFAHIVSPVSAYIKNTPSTPLMVNYRCTNSEPNVHNATVFRELDLEPRQQQKQIKLFGEVDAEEEVTVTIHAPIKGLPPLRTCPLPRKRYECAEYQHFVDERTPITIPGGQKIHKYLDSAILPAVLRHEGKLKMPTDDMEDFGQGASGSGARRIPLSHSDSTLGDVSVMSGEISLYTIKDAQKF